jgi:hypothetical protein
MNRIKLIGINTEGSLRLCLFRSENAVAGIAEAGANVGSLVQAAVQMPDVNLDIGVCVVQFFQAFGSGDKKLAV